MENRRAPRGSRASGGVSFGTRPEKRADPTSGPAWCQGTERTDFGCILTSADSSAIDVREERMWYVSAASEADRKPSGLVAQAFPSQAVAALYHLAQIHAGRIDDHRVGGGLEWRDGALGIVSVAPPLVRQHLAQGDGQAFVQKLGVPARGARLVVRREEELHVCVGKDDGPDVPALQDRAPHCAASELALQTEQLLTDHRARRHDAGPAADLGSADGRGDVLSVQQHPLAIACGRERDLQAAIEEAGKGGVVLPTDARPLRSQGHRAIDGAGVDDGEAEPARQLARDRALARTGGTVDGDDRWHGRSVAQGSRSSKAGLAQRCSVTSRPRRTAAVSATTQVRAFSPRRGARSVSGCCSSSPPSSGTPGP